MFELGETYRNRHGDYVVDAINGNKMDVTYANGDKATLNVAIQYRIWQNIVLDQEASAPKQTKKSAVKVRVVRHHVKTISISESELSIPGLKQRIAAAPAKMNLEQGDRIIYFAVELKAYFAVVTVTGKPKKAKAKDYLYGEGDATQIAIYPIDVDNHIVNVDHVVNMEAIDLESLSSYKEDFLLRDQFYPISEDDFELIAEMIAESGEEDKDDDVYMENEESLLGED